MLILFDFLLAVASYWYETDEASKAKKREQAHAEVIPVFLSKFDELVKENNGYLANGTVSNYPEQISCRSS